MNRLKKTYEKRNATQPKVNHKSHIQHIQTLTNEMEQLREREHRLAERLISEQPLINELRHSPRFIKEADKSCLAALVDDVYNNFPFPESDGNGYPILYSYQTSFYGIANCRTIGHLSYFSLPAEITDEEAHPNTGARALHRWRNTGRVAEQMVKGGFSRYIPSF